MSFEIVRRRAGPECAAILAELPQWFGIAESNDAYAELAGRKPVWVAEDGGRAIGLMILKNHGFAAVENHLLAVRPEAHGRGIGRALIERARAVAREAGASYLLVKTLGPSYEYEPYARTRAFYRRMGFEALEETTAIWGPENPCLIMVSPVSALVLPGQ